MSEESDRMIEDALEEVAKIQDYFDTEPTNLYGEPIYLNDLEIDLVRILEVLSYCQNRIKRLENEQF